MIKFLHNNLIDSALIVASSENAQYPLTNLKDERRTKCYRSTSNSDNIVIDLGLSTAVDSFALVDNWQNGFGVTSITLEANGVDSWASPAFSTTITFDTKFGVGINNFAEQTYRFWRIVLSSTIGYCELANIFLGKASTITTNGVGYNWAYRNNDLKKVNTNRYGQEFIDYYGQRKELTNLQFQIMDKDEQDVLLDLFDNVGTIYPFFVDFPLADDSLVNNDNRYSGFYTLSSAPSFTNINSGYYNTVLNLRESK